VESIILIVQHFLLGSNPGLSSSAIEAVLEKVKSKDARGSISISIPETNKVLVETLSVLEHSRSSNAS